MPKNNRLILAESEMKGPRGHFLDNFIETTRSFEKNYSIILKKLNHMIFKVLRCSLV